MGSSKKTSTTGTVCWHLPTLVRTIPAHFISKFYHNGAILLYQFLGEFSFSKCLLIFQSSKDYRLKKIFIKFMELWKNQMLLDKYFGPIIVLFTCQIIKQKIHDTWFFGQLHFWILWLGCQEFLVYIAKRTTLLGQLD